jgi:ABC-type antimicrobial peptide transport system permease subunit
VIVVRGLKPTAVGIAAGFVAAIALGRVVTSMVYGVSARDTATLVSVMALMVVVSLAASVVPAVRATRVSPLAVIREE